MHINAALPARCAICGYNICYDELPVCSSCAHNVQTFITTPCINCGHLPHTCTCLNPDRVRYLMFFRGADLHRVMYRLKCRGDLRTLAFFAELTFFANGINPETIDGIAYVPRMKKNRLFYGYDQSRIMAKSLAKRYGIPFVDILKRDGGNVQKLLSRSGRIKNIKQSIRLTGVPEEKYKRLLLIDDIYTSGATITACAELLREQAARSVIPLVVTKSNIRKLISR